MTGHTLGIIAGLVIGIPLGIFTAVLTVTRIPSIRASHTLKWGDLTGVAFFGGIGSTVALLVGDLSYGTGSRADDHVRVGVFAGSLIAALIGATLLAVRSARFANT